jgi:hypothetical protein
MQVERFALAKEWPVEIVALIEPIMWGKVKSRTVTDIARETKALMEKAASAFAAVQKVKRRRAAPPRVA